VSGGHLTQELLDAWYTGREDRFTVLGTVLSHLDERCPGCRSALREPEPVDVEAAMAEGAARARLRAEELEDESRLLIRRLAELAVIGIDPAEVALEDRRLRTLAFVEHLVERAAVRIDRGEVEQPAASESSELRSGPIDHLETASEISLRLDPSWYGEPCIRYAQARIFLLMARAQVARGQTDEAAETAAMGTEAWREAGEPATLQPLLFLALADLALADGKAERALGYLERATGSARWAGVATLAAARLERWSGAPSAAIERLRLLLRDDDRELDEWLERRLRAELVLALVAAEDRIGAGKALAELTELAELTTWADERRADRNGLGDADDPLESFARGKLLLLTGQRPGITTRAEAELLAARRGALEQGNGLAAAGPHLAVLRRRLQACRLADVPDLIDLEDLDDLASDLVPFTHCPGRGRPGMDRPVLARLSELAGAISGSPGSRPPLEALHRAEAELVAAHGRRGMTARGDLLA
jgi:hypothetical protein